ENRATPGYGHVTELQRRAKPCDSGVYTGPLARAPNTGRATTIHTSGPSERWPGCGESPNVENPVPDMAGEEQHDGAGKHEDNSPHTARDRQQGTRPARAGASPKDSAGAKLIQTSGSGPRGPLIRRPVMTVLWTLSVIVAGIATYGKLAVNDLPAVDYPVIQVTCAYPGAN